MHIRNAYIIYVQNLKITMMKEVFIPLERRLVNTNKHHRLHSYLLLMEFYSFSIDYAIVPNLLCTYFC